MSLIYYDQVYSGTECVLYDRARNIHMYMYMYTKFAYFMIIQDSDNADFMSMDLGIITNTGMRTDSSSNILQVGFFLYSFSIHGSMKIM